MFDNFEIIYIIISGIISFSSTSYVFYRSYQNIKKIESEDKNSS
jgi:hypothetical protein